MSENECTKPAVITEIIITKNISVPDNGFILYSVHDNHFILYNIVVCTEQLTKVECEGGT